MIREGYKNTGSLRTKCRPFPRKTSLQNGIRTRSSRTKFERLQQLVNRYRTKHDLFRRARNHWIFPRSTFLDRCKIPRVRSRPCRLHLVLLRVTPIRRRHSISPVDICAQMSRDGLEVVPNGMKVESSLSLKVRRNVASFHNPCRKLTVHDRSGECRSLSSAMMIPPDLTSLHIRSRIHLPLFSPLSVSCFLPHLPLRRTVS
ncbi:hypothetical protein BCR39DRAFT_254917 [Naematelia encephala]|uniref:Uncharacterized protein n=1 Tax=Naematelia encephala TaxID=71784 RepID=A0A1Y2AVY3_9TREE|nr:hypothetical protein BCR39DRAFT_254917 [Naematelia encephala]